MSMIRTLRSGVFSGASVYDTSTQSLSNGTLTAINFDAEDYDTDSYHDTVTNNTRLTVPSGGKYLIRGTVGFAANGTGARTVAIRKNGSAYLTFETLAPVPTSPASRDTVITTSRTVNLSASDYVELMARQDSGGSLDSNLSSGIYPRLEIARVD